MVNTTKAVSLIPMCGKMDSIQLYVIKFVIDLLLAGGFLLVLLIPLPLKLMAGWCFSPGTSDSSSIKADGWLVVFSWYF
jgi:hypothetical protein